MKTMSYLTGNLLFDGSIQVSKIATIKIIIDDVTITDASEKVYEKAIEFDRDSLPLFKYLPFELKDFEHEPSRRYELSAHMDMNNSGKIESGDYITTQSHPVVTALEDIDVQLSRVE